MQNVLVGQVGLVVFPTKLIEPGWTPSLVVDTGPGNDVVIAPESPPLCPIVIVPPWSLPLPLGTYCSVAQSFVSALPCQALPQIFRTGDDCATLDVAAVVLFHENIEARAVVVLNAVVSEPIVNERLPVGLDNAFHATADEMAEITPAVTDIVVPSGSTTPRAEVVAVGRFVAGRVPVTIVDPPARLSAP